MATDWSRLTVVDLRQQLKQRGLSTTGKKAELVQRLTAAETEAQKADTHDALQPEQPAQPEQTPTAVGNTHSVPQPDLSPEGVGLSSAHTTNPFPNYERDDGKGALGSIGEPENNVENRQPTTTEISEDVKMEDPPAVAMEEAPANLMEETPADVKEDAAIPDEPAAATAAAALSPDISRDTRGRKRRSRTPPPSDNESSRKRNRPNDPHEDNSQPVNGSAQVNEEVLPLDDDRAGPDVSYAKLRPDFPTEHQQEEDSSTAVRDSATMTYRSDHDHVPSRTAEDSVLENVRDVEPAKHPATSALYIKNFMRPLKEQDLREYLEELAAPPGETPDPGVIVAFFLDAIRTHCFVEFASIAAAARVRVELHNKVWPLEGIRKPLEADFVPPEKIPEWTETEKANRERGKLYRWEVVYTDDGDNGVSVELVDMANIARNQPIPNVPIPTGPSRGFSGIEGAPSGPRGRGHFRDSREDGKLTAAGPQIRYKPVSEELARRRLDDLRSYYITDRYRANRLPHEINRYTFEMGDRFVDRGVEVFVGIRRPNGRRNRRRAGPPFRPRGDRYIGGAASRQYDAPRSRFGGAPLSTFGGGSGGRPKQWGGGRRNQYWGHRY